MARITLPEGFTLKGNELSDSQNAVLSVLEAKVRGELTNDKAAMFLRMDSTGENIINMPGVGLALYRVTTRILWGSTWSEDTGTKRQKGIVRDTYLTIDQVLSIDFNIPEFDIERFLKSPTDIGVQIVTNWTASFTRNLYENFEAIFLQGMKDYFIAKSLVLPINLIGLNEQQAVDAYWKIWARNNKLAKKVDDITLGTNRADLLGAIGIDSNLGLSKAFVRLNYSNIAADTIVTGKRYSSAIAGMEFYESFYLEQDFIAGTKTALHLEKSYSLKNVHGFVVHKSILGMPISFTKMRNKLDNNTDNIRIIGKALYALPAVIRPDLGYLIMPEMPSVAEIQAAQLKDKLTNPTASGSVNNGLDNFDGKLTYQSVAYDNLKLLDLENIIYFNNLGSITIAGETATATEITTAIINAGNKGLDTTKVNVTNITANSALITSKDNTDTYYNEVTVTFTKAGTEAKQLPSNSEIQLAILQELEKLSTDTEIKKSDVKTNEELLVTINKLQNKVNNLEQKVKKEKTGKKPEEVKTEEVKTEEVSKEE